MSPRTVAEKMGIRPGIRGILVTVPQDLVPEDVVADIGLPEIDLHTDLVGAFDYIHLFTRTQDTLDQYFPRLKPHLAPRGKLWVSWPKGRKPGSDLTLKDVIRIGYAHGLVESTCLSVNDTWSALKFTHPIEGKTYANSYGTLPKA